MKLFILKSIAKRGFDEMHGCVVRAVDCIDARRAASALRGDEGMDVWLKDELSTCEPLKGAGPRGLVIRDFNAG